MRRSVSLEMLGSRFEIRCETHGWAELTTLLWEPFVVRARGNGEPVTIDAHEEAWRISCAWHPDLVQADPWLLSNELRHLLVEEALKRSSAVAIHAAAVAREGKALVMVGESGAGKTTLTFELAKTGWSYVTDDLVVLDEGGRLHPFPKPLGVKEPDRWNAFADRFDSLEWPPPPRDLFLVPPRALGWIGPAESLRVAAIAFIQRGHDRSARIEKLSGARALADLGAYSRPIDAASVGVLGAICAQATCARLVSDDPPTGAKLLGDLIQ